jgi:hypothetical protein
VVDELDEEEAEDTAAALTGGAEETPVDDEMDEDIWNTTKAPTDGATKTTEAPAEDANPSTAQSNSGHTQSKSGHADILDETVIAESSGADGPAARMPRAPRSLQPTPREGTSDSRKH